MRTLAQHQHALDTLFLIQLAPKVYYPLEKHTDILHTEEDKDLLERLEIVSKLCRWRGIRIVRDVWNVQEWLLEVQIG